MVIEEIVMLLEMSCHCMLQTLLEFHLSSAFSSSCHSPEEESRKLVIWTNEVDKQERNRESMNVAVVIVIS